MSKPSAKSSGRTKRAPIPQSHGGALVPGAGGGPQPGSGRPPDEFKAMCRELVTRDATWKAVQTILKNPGHQHYLGALKWAAEHGYGKPKETLDLNITDIATLSDAELDTRRKQLGLT